MTEVPPTLVRSWGWSGSKPAVPAGVVSFCPDETSRAPTNKVICCCGIRGGKIGTKFDSFIIQTERFFIGLTGPFVCIGQPAQKQIVGIEAFGWLAPGTVDFCLFESWRDGTNDTRRHLVL